MEKFLIFILVSVIFGQFPYQLNGLGLRTFGFSFNTWKKEYEQNAKILNTTKQFEIEWESRKSHEEEEEEEEARRKIFQKYLLPYGGLTSILKDFYNRI